MPRVVADSSCLIALDNIHMLSILKDVYGKIYISEQVLHEFGKSVQDWIVVTTVKDKIYMQILNNLIDLGEASTIALSLEIEESLVILDDLKARKIAQNLNLKFTGLLGILLKAKREGKIQSVRLIISKLEKNNFRISQKVKDRVIELAGE